MTKTIAQIQYEMETVKLIKSALDVNGETAYRMFKEWTSKEEKGLYIKDKSGKIILEASEEGGVKISKVDEILNKEYDIAKGIITGGSIESEKPTIINVSLNIENLRSAKDLANEIGNAMRAKGKI